MVRNPAVVARVTARYCHGKATVVLAAAILLLSGCAPISPNAKYLFAPEVRTCPPYLASDGKYYVDHSCAARVDEPLPTSQAPGAPSSVTVSQATNYARQIEEEYIGAKSEYGSISSATGLLLIPAGASALALGAEGGSAAAVSALGFGSAGVLGLGYWLSNTKREKVYMTGADALECLIGTMQPFDVEQTDFKELEKRRDDMSEANSGASLRTDELVEQLTRVRSNPAATKNPCAKPVLCYAEQALKAAKSNSQAQSKAYDAALKYELFSERYAGNAMVSVTNTINNKVNEVMTDTEPDLHALASRLSGAIPQSAQSLAGISTASTATSTAAILTQKTEIAKPEAEKAEANLKAAAAGTGGGVCGTSNPDSVGEKASDELGELFERSEALQIENTFLLGQTETVVDLTPDVIKPKTESCTKLFDQPGVAPDVLTLNPDGYIAVTQGEKKKVTISGGKLPFAVRLMCDCYDKGITAETDYDSGKATIEISASASASVNSYPLMVTDSTGIGRPLIIVVSKKAGDSADTPDCPSAEESAIASIGDVKAMAELAASAHSYAVEAADAKTAADKALKSHKANDASDAASKAYSAAAKAQALAAEATASAAGSKDPIIQNLAQAAYAESQKAAQSAAEAAADAARAATAAQKPGR